MNIKDFDGLYFHKINGSYYWNNKYSDSGKLLGSHHKKFDIDSNVKLYFISIWSNYNTIYLSLNLNGLEVNTDVQPYTSFISEGIDIKNINIIKHNNTIKFIKLTNFIGSSAFLLLTKTSYEIKHIRQTGLKVTLWKFN